MVLGAAAGPDLTQPWHDGGPVFGDPRLAPNRLGQQGFKAVVADAYHWRCAITGARIRPVLEAAHIRPVSPRYGGESRLDNGLLLRSDVHRIFDLGYLSVDTRYRLRVSSLLRPTPPRSRCRYVRAAARRPGLPSAVRHTRAVPSPPPLMMMTGVPSGSPGRHRVHLVVVARQRLADRAAVGEPPHPSASGSSRWTTPSPPSWLARTRLRLNGGGAGWRGRLSPRRRDW
jgi:hypothetical protein